MENQRWLNDGTEGLSHAFGMRGRWLRDSGWRWIGGRLNMMARLDGSGRKTDG